MSAAAYNVHGIRNKDLEDEPRFIVVAKEMNRFFCSVRVLTACPLELLSRTTRRPICSLYTVSTSELE